MQDHSQAPWLAQGQAKEEAVQSIFSKVSGTYDLVNSLMSLRLHHRWRAQAVDLLQLQPGQSVLDVCCGTGSFFDPITKAVGDDGTVVGIDFCQPMLEIARQKFGDSIQLILGDACALPIQSNLFDGVTVGWGLRNVSQLDQCLSEICRVLKPGGRFVTIDMARPQGQIGAISEKICHAIVPILGAAVGKKEAYTYLNQSTLQFASREELARRMELAGFEEIEYHDLFGGNICIHLGRKA